MEKEICRYIWRAKKDFRMYPHSFRRGSEFQFFFRPNSIFRKLISLLAIWALTIGTLPAYAAPLPRYGPPVLAGQKALLPQLPEPLLQKQMARIAGGQPEQPKFALQKPIARLAALKKPAVTALQSSSAVGVFVGYADSSAPSLNFPTPWQDSPNIVFIGGGAPVNAGAIRIDNPGSVPPSCRTIVAFAVNELGPPLTHEPTHPSAYAASNLSEGAASSFCSEL